MYKQENSTKSQTTEHKTSKLRTAKQVAGILELQGIQISRDPNDSEVLKGNKSQMSWLEYVESMYILSHG